LTSSVFQYGFVKLLSIVYLLVRPLGKTFGGREGRSFDPLATIVFQEACSIGDGDPTTGKWNDAAVCMNYPFVPA